MRGISYVVVWPVAVLFLNEIEGRSMYVWFVRILCVLVWRTRKPVCWCWGGICDLEVADDNIVNGSVYCGFFSISCIISILTQKRKRSGSFVSGFNNEIKNSLSSFSSSTSSRSSLHWIPLFNISNNCCSTGFNFLRFVDPVRSSCLTELADNSGSSK